MPPPLFRKWTPRTLETLGISFDFFENFAAAFPGVPYIDDLKEYPKLVQTLMKSKHINETFFICGDISKQPRGLHSFLQSMQHTCMRLHGEGAVDAMVIILFNLLGLANQGPLV